MGNYSRKILESGDLSRIIARISHQIIENNEDLSSLVIVGIHTRGVPLAKRIAENINRFGNTDVPLGELDVPFYRDDFEEKGAKLTAAETSMPEELDGKTVVLVDDVLFTGRSIRAAVDHIIDLGRPGKVQLVALLDRGHRELPIRADYVGKNIPTARGQQVRVLLSEIDGEDGVYIEEGDDA